MDLFKMDFHVHSDFSPDSKTPMEEMVKAAISKGITDLCFTEHIDYDSDPKSSILSWDFDKERYFSMLETLKTQYRSRIKLYRGVEIGLQPTVIDKNQEVLKNWPFDFVIGSLHTIDLEDLYAGNFFDLKAPKQAVINYYESYYKNVVAFQDFDVLGHLDLYLRYSASTLEVPLDDYLDVMDLLLKFIIERGKGIEVNAGGYRYGLNQNNPGDKILKRYFELGGEVITLGSDAHSIDYLGFKYFENIELLRRIGFSYVSIFENRKPKFIKIK